MSDTNNPNISGTNHANPKCRRGLGRKLFWVFLIAVGVLAVSRPLTALHRPFGPRASWGRGHSSLQKLEEQVNRGADWVLDRLDATEEQRNQMQAIQNNLMPDLYALQNEHWALHDRFRQALDTDPVNREELEQIRTASLDLADRALQRAVDSFVQVLDVLTPEQRTELLEMWRQRQ